MQVYRCPTDRHNPPNSGSVIGGGVAYVLLRRSPRAHTDARRRRRAMSSLACFAPAARASARASASRLRTRGASRPSRLCSATRDDRDAAPEEELDFVTRMVMNVFGKDALDDPEPMGLKRMTKEDWPDQWPALCDGTLAEPLESDDTEELRRVRAVLAQTQLEYQPLGIAYDANVHGWRERLPHPARRPRRRHPRRRHHRRHRVRRIQPQGMARVR